MHPHRRRKKRNNYGLRTVDVERGPNGFGFTISGQQPCILSCIVNNSPADQAGLRAGDFLISVNGLSVSKSTHDAVVKLIGSSIGPIKMSIAEYYYSDSSDEEIDVTRMASRKPKYMHKPRLQRTVPENVMRDSPKKNVKLEYNKLRTVNENASSSKVQQNVNPMEFKALVGYLGTIEMPKQLLPNSKLQTVCSCIRKLRQEKRTPTAVLMTVLPECLTLKNANSQILAIYPANRVIYISSTTDKDSRYFGIVTSAMSENNDMPYVWNETKPKMPEVEVSNSCHVFITDPKLVDHKLHFKQAERFDIICTPDIITGNCLEFPQNALYIVSLVQNMYRLQSCNNEHKNYLNDDALIANSPQPSASSNSDSGIGFRDDCGNISDRILVVEFPAQKQPPIVIQQNNRPIAIDGSINNIDLSQENYVNNIRATKNSPKKFESPKKSVLNVRACDESYVITKEDKQKWNNRLTVRAMPDPIGVNVSKNVPDYENSDFNETFRTADVDTGQIFTECPVDVPENDDYFETENTITDFKSSVDNISVNSFQSCDFSERSVFKTPYVKYVQKTKKQNKQNSCENISDDNLLNYKLCPKVYGVAKPALSCEELSSLESTEKCGFGSLQDLYTWNLQDNVKRTGTVSEPDIRIERKNKSSNLDLMSVSILFCNSFFRNLSCKLLD